MKGAQLKGFRIKTSYVCCIDCIIGHVHTAAEYGCQSCICVLNTVTFTHTLVIYGVAWQPHSATELTPVHFQDSQPHSWNTRAVWMEQDWTTSCLSRHTAGERDTLRHTSARLLCGVWFHVFSVTFSDWEMSCVSSERFRSRQFSTGAAPVSFVFCARSRDSKAPLSTQMYKLLLMNIWWKNSQLDWTLVMSESDKTFSFMDVAIFDFTLVTVAMFTGKKYGLDFRCTFIQTVY